LAGFFDGEGCISIVRQTETCYVIQCSATQNDRRPLYMLKIYFGGSICNKTRRVNGKSEVYTIAWSISANKALSFLVEIEPFLILKRKQAQIAIDFQRDKVDCRCQEKNIREVVKRQEQFVFFKKVKHRENMQMILSNILHDKIIRSCYVAGFLDAEGTMHIRRQQHGRYVEYSLRCGVTQKDRLPLLLLQSLYGGIICNKRNASGQISCYQWEVNANKALNILTDAVDYMMVKKLQAELALMFQHRLKENRIPGKHFKRRLNSVRKREWVIRDEQLLLMKQLNHNNRLRLLSND